MNEGRISKISEVLLDRFRPRGRGDDVSDAVLVASVRMALGCIVAWRSWFIANDAAFYFESSEWLGLTLVWQSVVGWALFGLGILLAIGLWTRSVAAILFLVHAWFAIWTTTNNISPMLMVPMFAGFVVLNAGAVYSVDSMRGRGGKLPRWRDLQKVSLILFTFCAVLHFSAVIFHLKDENWMAGLTSALLFTNSYMSRFYEFFRWFESIWPAGLIFASMVGGVVQTIFQLAMIPMVFFKWSRLFVIFYGGFFIVVSLLGIQISILPIVEVVLWAWVFMPSEWLPKKMVDHVRQQNPSIRDRHLRIVNVYSAVFAFLMLIFVADVLSTQLLDRPFPTWVRRHGLHYAGLLAPNVFNREDISMGDHWTIILRDDNGHKTALPLNGSEGQRLSWHRSDLLYYANSLQWRRGAIEIEDWHAFHTDQKQRGTRVIPRLLRYDYRRIGASGPVQYRVLVYGNQASLPEIGNMERYQSHLVYSSTYEVTEDSLRLMDASTEPQAHP